MNKTKNLILISILLIFLLQNVSAYQRKLTLKECFYSFNDINFGSWDGQKGIFLKINNSNLKLGDGENPSYSHTSYQTFRGYYNNFNGYNPSGVWPYNSMSAIPILNVSKANPENKVYINCTYVVGDYKISIKDYYAAHAANGNGLLITHDFNLTTGIIKEDTQSYATTGFNYNNQWNFFSHYPVSIQRGSDSVYYVDNCDDMGGSTLLFDDAEGIWGGECYESSKNPNIISVFDLKNWTSGLFRGSAYFRENGYDSLFTPSFNIYFYIDSDMQDPMDFLIPRFLDEGTNLTIWKNKGTGSEQKKYGYYCNLLGGVPNCLAVNYGDKITVEQMLRNDFNFTLNNIDVKVGLASSYMSTGGVGESGTDVAQFGGFSYSESMTFLPNETKKISVDFNLPSNINMLFGSLLLSRQAKSTNLYSNSRTDWPAVGYDNFPYFGFGRFDPRIEMIRDASGKFRPFFNMSVDLLIMSNPAYSPIIWPGDYELLVEIWNGSISNPKNFKNSNTIILDETEFIKMGKPCPGPNCKLEAGRINDYNILVPVTEEYMREGASGADYRLVIYSVYRLTTPYRKIAKLMKIPYFKPGDIAIPEDDGILHFSENSTRDYERITILNPSFYEIDVNLGVSYWEDNENFTINWVNEAGSESGFGKYSSKTEHLKPGGSQLIKFWVNATYPIWPDNSIQKNLVINASAKIGGTIKTTLLYYKLNVTNGTLIWFNFDLGACPSGIFLEDFSKIKNQNMNFSWIPRGSEDRYNLNYKNKVYNVSLKLMNKTNNNNGILNETSKEFILGEAVNELDKIKNLSISYNFGIGEYVVNLSVDSNKKISEIDTSGRAAEGDNQKECIIPIMTCSYDSVSQQLYYYNLYPTKENDAGCNCKHLCPLDFSCSFGSGRCLSMDDPLCYDNALIDVCNNETRIEHKGGFCAWNCTGGPCPQQVSFPAPLASSGACKTCTDITSQRSDSFLPCSGYNNNATCEADPCGETKDIAGMAVLFNLCDGDPESYCVWNYTEDRCLPSGWEVKELQNCSKAGAIFAMYNITVNLAPTGVTCNSTLVKFPCPRRVQLPFFSLIGLVLASVLVVVVYVVYLKRKK